MSEVINKYLDFGGLQKYDTLIKEFIAKGNGTLADAIDALTTKIGNIDVEGSDNKTLSEIVEDIYASIAEIVEKQGSLDDKDAELEGKINDIIGDLESLNGSDAVMTLVTISNKLKALDDANVVERLSAVEKTVADLGKIEGGESLGDIVNKVNANAEAIETLKGDGEGSVKKAAADAQAAAIADAAGKYQEKGDYEAAGAAAQALIDAQAYVDDKVDGKFDEAGAAAAAQAAAEATASADATSKANAAESAAKAYADGLVKDEEGKSLFDATGSAASAEQNAKDYADSLATNYDVVGSAADAQAAAEATAKAYADSLIADEDGNSKFDAAGAAADAQAAAIAHANEVAGANTELINGLSDRIGSLEGISQAANVVYNEETKYINIVDKDGNVIGAGFDASPFIVDGMLDGVAFEEVEGVKTNNLVFTFNTAAGKENVVVDFTKYVDIYQGDGSSIELNSETKTFSVKEVDASKTKLSTSIEVNGGPLADDASDNWPWTEGGKKIIPAGKTMEEILTSLFLKVTNGTVSKGGISWSPSLSAPSVSITESGTVEVGTKLTATANTTNTVSSNTRSCTFTCKPGHFLSTGTDSEGKLIFGSYVSGNKTVNANAVNPSYDGTPSIKTYWNGEEVANVNGTTEYTVSIVGTNTFKVDQSGVTAYAGAFDDITVYGSTNTKVPVESVKASITGDTAPAAKNLTSTNKAEVTGARAYWMGSVKTAMAEFTSATIRAAGESDVNHLTKALGTDVPATVTATGGDAQVVIATQKEITEVFSKNQIGANVFGNFNHHTVNIEGANGFTGISYHVYEWAPANPFDKDDILTITYK